MSPEESLRPAPGEVWAPEGDGGVVQGEQREAGPQPPHQHRAAHPLSPGVAQTDPDPAGPQHRDIDIEIDIDIDIDIAIDIDIDI